MATILIVHEDAKLQDVLRKVLEKAGYSVALAQSGLEALELLQAKDHGFQLLIGAVNLQRGTSTDLIQEVSANHPGMGMVFLTGNLDNRVACEIREKFKVEVRPTPISNKDLLECVDSHTKKTEEPVAPTSNNSI